MASQDPTAVDDGAETVDEPVILSVQDERKELRGLGLNGNITLKPNDTWYPVDFRWYQQWMAYTQWDKKDAEVDLENLHELGNERPGPIDNTELFDPEDPAQISLKKALSENETHVFVHSDFWQRFMKWYGGGPAFPRDVVARGTGGMDKRIDMYPQFFNVVFAQEDGTYDAGQGEFQRFPRDSTMQQVVDKIGKTVNATDTKPVRVYTKLGKIKGLFVSSPANKDKVTEDDLKNEDDERMVEIPDDQLKNLKLEDLDFDGVQLLLCEQEPYPLTKGEDTWKEFLVGDTIDAKDMQKKWYQSIVRGVKEEDGVKRICVHYLGWDERWDEWMEVNESTLGPRLAKRGTHTQRPYRRKEKKSYQTSYSGYSSYSSGYGGGSWSHYKDDVGSSMQKGIVGLRNLGNTCFMNSTIQCLAQSPILSEYFLKGTYKSEINADNPLGWKGQVANAWADLISKMFSNSYRTIAPREFKQAIGTVAPRFMGYSQQDSQELLSFLLDGLHEDLNRILNKPYTEPVESDGRPDTVVANHAWKTYLMRNQSIIVDVLQGQYKSTVVCPDCGYVSITFDPYMFLSVPLPTEKYKNVTLTYCDLTDPNIPPKVYGLKILKIGDMRALKQEVATKVEIPNKDLYVCDVWKNKIHKVYTDHDMVQDIRRNTDDIWVIRSPCLFAAENYFEDLPDEPDEERAPATSSNSRYYSSGYSSKPKKIGPWKNYYVHSQFKPPPRQSTSYSRTYTTSSMDEVFGAPNLLTLPTKVPVTGNQVRARIMEMVTPYLRDPTAELPFTFNMQIGYSKTVPLPDTDEPLDLQPNSTHTQIRFVLQWQNKDGYKTEVVDERERDESAGEAPAADSRGGYSSYGRNSEARNTAPIDLFQCFDAFTEEETLSENDAWRCKQCQDFKCANKKIDLWSSPDLLVIHLKRFSYTRLWRDRINTLVNFPLEGLDMSPYVLNPEMTDNVYDLYAVSNHMGGLGGGHYTAYAKSLENGDWYHLDDSRTSPVANPESIVSSSAYVLYYRKRVPYGITHRASLYHIPGLGDDGDDDQDAN